RRDRRRGVVPTSSRPPPVQTLPVLVATHEGIRRAGQQFKSLQGLSPVGEAELCENTRDARRVKDGFGLPYAAAVGRQSEQHPPPVFRIPCSSDVTLLLESMDRKRHRSHGDAHALSQIRH